MKRFGGLLRRRSTAKGLTPGRPRVLIVSASVGAGHNQAARAILAGLTEADPGIDAEWVDALALTGSWFRWQYAGGYALLVTRLPWLYGFGYRLMDRPVGPRLGTGERLRMLFERRALRRFRRIVMERRPVLVVSTHFLSPPAVGRWIADGVEGIRQMVVVTDHHMHRFWCSPHAQRYFVPDEYARERLLDFGVDPERIEQSGIPVHPKWTRPLDEGAIRSAWNLPGDKPFVLISGGVDFTIGPIEKLAVQLCRRMPDVRVGVLAGGNKALAASLAGQPEAQGACPRLRAIPFTDRIHELSHLADLMVTKPGGMTISECATQGTPCVLLKPVPGQEAFNARYLVEKGGAVQAQTMTEALDLVIQLLRDRSRLDRLKSDIAQLARPATAQICAQILEAIRK